MPNIVSIDIGSTFTKGALFSASDDRLQLERRAACPTTTDNLSKGFENILQQLSPKDVTITYSSSAKGGLAIAAIGIVPDLTLKVASEAALSAGGRMTSVYTYKLTAFDVESLLDESPDVILLTGGTDGGNEEYPLHNARMLAGSKVTCPIIYAGNRSIVDEIQSILDKKQLLITDNVLPNLEQPQTGPARSAIRDIFIHEIVKGKGLDQVAACAGTRPRPTPLAMLEFVQTIRETVPEFGDFAVIDIGGATTDFYSTNPHIVSDSAIYKGLPEPQFKRTVEGDLGMRVTATSTMKMAAEKLPSFLADGKIEQEDFTAYVHQINADHGHLPDDNSEQGTDQILAEICASYALLRHAGWQEQIFTIDGERSIQRGKDIRPIQKVIGTGGYLSHAVPFDYLRAFQNIATLDRRHLIPSNYTCMPDAEYLMPLLANAAQQYPAEAARTAVTNVEQTFFQPER